MKALWQGILVVVAIALGLSLYFIYNKTGARGNFVPAEISEEAVARSVLSYAIDPMFSSSNLLSDLNGTKANLVMHVLDEDKLYFSLPNTEDWALARDCLTKQPEKIEFSRSTEAPYKLGSLILKKRDVYFFRIDADDFKIEPNARLHIPFRQAVYDPTARELAKFITNEVIMCGREYFAAEKVGKRTVYAANFGARVTVPRESSLTRLAKAIVGEEKDQSRAVQKLLDFVTNEIEYDKDEREWAGNSQVVKRANEVLMTKRATCASKAALYASLLEQIDGDYIFAYYPKHLTVFVYGQYSDSNGHSIVYEGKRYHLAETTNPGFVIGYTKMEPEFSPENDWTHLQRPKDRDVPKAKK
ncbi:MAG: transglutaminase-like domain-containing protein [Patescibacteria group bacterium]